MMYKSIFAQLLANKLTLTATAIATMGAIAIGCGSNGDGNPAGGSGGNNGGSNTKENVQAVINGCFANSAELNRTAVTKYANAVTLDDASRQNMAARGCAGVPGVQNCDAGIKQSMKTEFKNCIYGPASQTLQPGERVGYAIDFDVNGAQSTNHRSRVEIIDNNVGNGYSYLQEMPY
jgi:hypothetical protein